MIKDAIEVLRNHQEQCDFDGVFVKVSRQALDEVLGLSDAQLDVITERREQHIFEDDAQYTDFELSKAGACYAMEPWNRKHYWSEDEPMEWPWDSKWWKPTTDRRDLIKAAALIIAEIERLDNE